MNALDDAAFHAWEPKPAATNETVRALKRMLRSKSMMAWAELLKDAVCANLEIHDGNEKARCFYGELNEFQLGQVKYVVNRLVAWKRWSSPTGDDMDRVL